MRSWPLEGGVSASMHGIEVAGPDGETQQLVVRQHGTADWRPHATGVTAREFALLAALRRLEMEVPEPCWLDETCELLPSPYLVMELVPGTTTVTAEALPDALRQMADFLARLHTVEVADADLPPLPDLEDPVRGALEYLPASDALADVRQLLSTRTMASRNRQSLLHGDFWPQNVLWHDGKIAAVVDWEDAALGDPLSDLACCRVELLCYYDEASMEAFTAHYCALAEINLEHLAAWELYVSAAAAATMSNWGLAPEVEAARRKRTVAFMERAASELVATFG